MSIEHSLSGLGKAVAAVAGLALAGEFAKRKGDDPRRADHAGQPLDRLDTSGEPPSGILLAGPDTVVLTRGERLAIAVEGSDAMVAAMRFHLTGGTLAVTRSRQAPKGETAVIRITMPPPETLVLTGSGRIETDGLAERAEVTIAGSGKVRSRKIEAESLKVNVVGSGRYKASGKVTALRLNLAGSGETALAKLAVDNARVNIAGSGKGAFRSDGSVRADIVGSGEVRVVGRAQCAVKAVGSGKLVCEPA